MKIFALVCGLLLGVSNAASAQSGSPSGKPGYFGTVAPGGAANPAPTKAADPAPQGSPVVSEQPSDQPSVEAPGTKAQGDAARLKKTVALLKTAKEKILATKASFTKAAPLASAEEALSTLKKTNGGGTYRGHRAKAIDKIKETIAELKAADQSKKADNLLDESIVEVAACVELAK